MSLTLPKTRSVRAHLAYPSFIIPDDAYSFRVNAGNCGVDSTFACCPGARDSDRIDLPTKPKFQKVRDVFYWFPEG